MNTLRLKQFIKFLTPHGVVLRVQEAEREKKRRNFLDGVASLGGQPQSGSFRWSDAIDFLERKGCPRQEVINGSMPETSLEIITAALRAEFGRTPVVGVHVGNFVGVSLACLADTLRSLHPDSVIIGIDPNLPHRGIENPQMHVSALLQNYGLTRNVVLLTAYSLEKSQSNDGSEYVQGYDPREHFHKESGCENGLRFVERFFNQQIDFLLIDGNHDDVYLSQELLVAERFLKPGGLLILDDVSEGWAGVKKRFEDLKSHYNVLAEDGRIGIVKSSK